MAVLVWTLCTGLRYQRQGKCEAYLLTQDKCMQFCIHIKNVGHVSPSGIVSYHDILLTSLLHYPLVPCRESCKKVHFGYYEQKLECPHQHGLSNYDITVDKNHSFTFVVKCIPFALLSRVVIMNTAVMSQLANSVG